MTTPECCTPSEEKKSCCCKKMPGLFLVLIGFTFLLRAAGFISHQVTGLIWPAIVILAGVGCMFRGQCKCCKTETK